MKDREKIFIPSVESIIKTEDVYSLIGVFRYDFAESQKGEMLFSGEYFVNGATLFQLAKQTALADDRVKNAAIQIRVHEFTKYEDEYGFEIWGRTQRGFSFETPGWNKAQKAFIK